MPKKKLTCKRKKFLLNDEAEAVKLYRELGYTKLAKQEAEHHRFLQKQACVR